MSNGCPPPRIDPSSPRIEPFYLKMREQGMVLLAHTGKVGRFPADARSLGTSAAQALDLGNRRGATAPPSAKASTWKVLGEGTQLDLLLRLMDEPR
jgi:hypothetical protein